MSNALRDLRAVWSDSAEPFLQAESGALSFDDIEAAVGPDLSQVLPGDVVAVVGDFDAVTIRILLELIDMSCIIVPLTASTENLHEVFFGLAPPDVVISGGVVTRLETRISPQNPLIQGLIEEKKPGLVLFTSGTTGQPKAIVHDFSRFLSRFSTPRPALRTFGFLLFDHIGGLNTLFHTLYNRGLVVASKNRQVPDVLSMCKRHGVELLPTTPTFLRMLLLSDVPASSFPESLRLITYGTERMDGPTLSRLCQKYPDVDFRQTYGMSELGILRTKSRARDSLWIQVGGEGVETKVESGTLLIRSQTRMLGYINAPSPFDDEGWFNTGDAVLVDGEWLRIVGRDKGLVNVGGLKFHVSEVEDVALEIPGVAFATAQVVRNPITGEHCELTIQPAPGEEVDLAEVRLLMREKLAPHKRPMKFRLGQISISPRYKQIPGPAQ